jgi:hypothetical protein
MMHKIGMLAFLPAVRDATISANHGVLGTNSGIESSDPAWRENTD